MHQVESEIVGAQWPAGHLLGTERELAGRYGVSWPVMRQAVRILQLHGFVEVRYGAKGGLVVGAPAAESVVEAIAGVLQYTGTGPDEVVEVLGDLHELAAQRSADRVSAARVRALGARLADPDAAVVGDAHAIRRFVESGTRNPVLGVLIGGLSLAHERMAPVLPLDPADSVTHRGHQRDVLDAIRRGRPVEAALAMRRSFDWLNERRRPAGTEWDRSAASTREHLSAALARAMARQLRSMIPGESGVVVGTPAELQERFGVSSTVLREAVRILEHHGVAHMQRGPGAGLVATTPDYQAVVAVLTRYVLRLQVVPAALLESRAALELRCIELAAQRLAAHRDAVEMALAAPAPHLGHGGQVVGPDVHVLLAHVAENRVLELFVRVMTSVTADTRIESSDLPAAHAAHRALLTALLDGDPILARAHLRDHLEQLGPWRDDPWVR